jgi:phospholipid/cholesterol/gamma-HCH transport system substrate-binding protein
MKNKSGNKMKLGIFVSIVTALLTVGVYFIGKKQQMFGSTFHISGIFKDVSGLEVGNNVRFSGINVGVVKGIQQITDTTVRVDMIIDEKTRKFIKKNAKAMVGSDGLMGNKIVSIIPGTIGDHELSNNDTIETAQTVNIDDILIKLRKTSDNSANITGDLAFIIKNIRDGKGTIGKLFSDTAFAQNVDDALVNIKQGAGGFKQNMDAASHNFLLKGYLKKKNDQKQDK